MVAVWRSSRVFAIGVLGLLLMTACSMLGSRNAIEFNNKLISMQIEIGTSVTTMVDNFTDPNLKSDVAKAELDKNRRLINAKLAELEALSAPEGGQDLKNAMRDLFILYKSLADNEYTQMIEIATKETRDASDVAKLEKLFSETQVKALDYGKKVIDAQTAFVKRFNIPVN